MGQARKLPKIKRLELAAKKLRPGPDAVAVGNLPDGTPIWEGPVSATNPYFHEHIDGQETDNGHERTPLIGPDGKQRWRRNKATGEAITPMFRNKRLTKTVRYIMVDDTCGGGGPRPVPMDAAEMRDRQRAADALPDYRDTVLRVAMEEGVSAEDLGKALAQLAAQSSPEAKRRGA